MNLSAALNPSFNQCHQLYFTQKCIVFCLPFVKEVMPSPVSISPSVLSWMGGLSAWSHTIYWTYFLETGIEDGCQPLTSLATKYTYWSTRKSAVWEPKCYCSVQCLHDHSSPVLFLNLVWAKLDSRNSSQTCCRYFHCCQTCQIFLVLKFYSIYIGKKMNMKT